MVSFKLREVNQCLTFLNNPNFHLQVLHQKSNYIIWQTSQISLLLKNSIDVLTTNTI